MTLSHQKTADPAPRVSVLINNYNNAAYLATCINSVLVQTRPADEIILFDDGSTDSSRQILERYRDKITILLGEHGTGNQMQNQARAVEEAFRASTGDLVFLLDGDDVFLPAKIEAYVEAFGKHPKAVMVQAPLERVDPKGDHIGLEYDAGRHHTNYREHVYATGDLNIFYPTSALAFRRSYLNERLPFDYSDGLPFWPDGRLSLAAPLWGEIVTLPLAYSQWRRHPKAHTIALPPPAHRLMRFSYAYFNLVAKQRGAPAVSRWRNRRYWILVARHYVFNERQMQLYRKLRWAMMGRRKRSQLLESDAHSVRIKEHLEGSRSGLVLPESR